MFKIFIFSLKYHVKLHQKYDFTHPCPMCAGPEQH